VGAVLVAVPLLLAGGADDDSRQNAAQARPDRDSATVLDEDAADAAAQDYATEKPSPSPSPEKSKQPTKPKKEAKAPVEVAETPRHEPSSTPRKPAASPKAARESAEPKPTPKETPRPVWRSETVRAISVLEAGQAWVTNRIQMVMQHDGNLVVYNENGNALWAAMTFGQNHRAIFQDDGNLVIHNGDDRPIWASRTHGHPGAVLVLRTDGKVVITAGGTVLWST
jgi:hypothetical protein